MIRSQFGAAIEMLENAMQAWPDELWGQAARGVAGFWDVAYLERGRSKCRATIFGLTGEQLPTSRTSSPKAWRRGWAATSATCSTTRRSSACCCAR